MALVITNEDIRTMGDLDLRRVYEITRAQIVARRTEKTLDATRSFRVGDTVEFTDRQGHKVQGMVKKTNIKTIAVTELDSSRSPGKSWKVHSTLLTKFG